MSNKTDFSSATLNMQNVDNASFGNIHTGKKNNKSKKQKNQIEFL